MRIARRAICNAIRHQDIPPRQSDRAAGGIQNTIGDQNILTGKTSDAVIARTEIAIRNTNVIVPLDMNAIMSCSNPKISAHLSSLLIRKPANRHSEPAAPAA